MSVLGEVVDVFTRADSVSRRPNNAEGLRVFNGCDVRGFERIEKRLERSTLIDEEGVLVRKRLLSITYRLILACERDRNDLRNDSTLCDADPAALGR